MNTNGLVIPGTSFDLSKVTSFLESMYGMPKVGLVLIFCIALCLWIHFVIKKLPFIPNYVIPIAIPCIVPFAGAIFLIGCQSWQESKIPTVGQFIFINVMVGFVSGTGATLIYYFGAMPLLRKFKLATNGDSNPPLPAATEMPK